MTPPIFYTCQTFHQMRFCAHERTDRTRRRRPFPRNLVRSTEGNKPFHWIGRVHLSYSFYHGSTVVVPVLAVQGEYLQRLLALTMLERRHERHTLRLQGVMKTAFGG